MSNTDFHAALADVRERLDDPLGDYDSVGEVALAFLSVELDKMEAAHAEVEKRLDMMVTLYGQVREYAETLEAELVQSKLMMQAIAGYINPMVRAINETVAATLAVQLPRAEFVEALAAGQFAEAIAATAEPEETE